MQPATACFVLIVLAAPAGPALADNGALSPQHGSPLTFAADQPAAPAPKPAAPALVMLLPEYPHPLRAVRAAAPQQVAAAAAEDKPVEKKPAPSLVSDHTKETLATMTAFQAAIDRVGARRMFTASAFIDK